jgi:uncharacterized membrane protein
MLRIAGILNPAGNARAQVSGECRSRAQRPFIDRLEMRALLASFQAFGPDTTANAVSADGSVVVGAQDQVYGGPFYWDQNDGVVLLHNSSGNTLGVLSKPTGVSQDGSVIVGGSVSGGGGGPAFLWANGVAAPIPQLASAQTSIADSVSADGSIIAGDIQMGSTMSGFTLTGTNLEIIPPSSLNLTTRGTILSANGAVVAGNIIHGFGTSTAYQWKNGALIQLPGYSGQSSTATAVSPDGAVVVGSVGYGNSGLKQPYEWTNGAVTPLALPSGFTDGSALGVSKDGPIIVGYISPNDLVSTAFIWNQTDGIQNLEQVLTTDDGLGSDLKGWTLTEATAITPNGTIIVGNGVDPQGQEEGWIVNLSTPPPPPPPSGPPAPNITWPKPADIVYGTKLGPAQLDAMASVPGTFTYSPPDGTVLHAGKAQSLSVTFTPTDTTDYTIVTHTVSINVSQATPTITWANPANIHNGTMLGPLQLDATASVPGILTYSQPKGKILAVGNNQTLSVSFTPADTSDYTDATASVTINVLPVIVLPPVGQVHNTKIVVTPAPRLAIPGRPIILTATVKNLSRKGGAPTGQIRFLDGTTILRTERLRRGQATLRISGRAFPLTIEVDYFGNLSFASSSSGIDLTSRARRSRR